MTSPSRHRHIGESIAVESDRITVESPPGGMWAVLDYLVQFVIQSGGDHSRVYSVKGRGMDALKSGLAEHSAAPTRPCGSSVQMTPPGSGYAWMPCWRSRFFSRDNVGRGIRAEGRWRGGTSRSASCRQNERDGVFATRFLQTGALRHRPWTWIYGLCTVIRIRGPSVHGRPRSAYGGIRRLLRAMARSDGGNGSRSCYGRLK